MYEVIPEVIPDTDGGVAIEWYHSKGNVLVISFHGTGKAVYARISDTTNKAHGVESFGESIPETLIYNIAKIAKPV